MGGTVRLGRIAGVPVAAHWSALVVPLLVADILGASVLPATVKEAGDTARWVTAVLVALAFAASLVAHEVAHAVVARRRGLRVTGITLWMLGGVTAIEGESPSPAVDLQVAVVGPATSLGCAALAGGAAELVAVVQGPKVAVAGLVWLAVSNALLAVFNLLPAAPLDGGRVLRAIVWRRTGDRDRAEAVAARSGRAMGFAFIGLGAFEALLTTDLVGGLWLALIGWFLMTSAGAEAAMARTRTALAHRTVGDVMLSPVLTVPDYQNVTVAARHAVTGLTDVSVVVDWDGEVAGIVTTDDLVRAAQLPTDVVVRRVTQHVEPAAVATPDEQVLDVLERVRGRLPLVAVTDHQVVGLVTADSITRAMRRALLAEDSVPVS